jgi:hypothetical protein
MENIIIIRYNSKHDNFNNFCLAINYSKYANNFNIICKNIRFEDINLKDNYGWLRLCYLSIEWI